MDFLLIERPVDAVEDDKANEDDEPECPVNTAGDAVKWTCHLTYYFLNKGLTKNYNTIVALESEVQRVVSSSVLTLSKSLSPYSLKI